VKAQLKVVPAGQELQSAITDQQTVVRQGDRPLADAVTVVMINEFCDSLASAVAVAHATGNEPCRFGI
jgi:hypothetical protein